MGLKVQCNRSKYSFKFLGPDSSIVEVLDVKYRAPNIKSPFKSGKNVPYLKFWPLQFGLKWRFLHQEIFKFQNMGILCT